MIVSKRFERAEASYERLLAQYGKTPVESSDAEARLMALVREAPIVELKTKSQRLFFVNRSISERGVAYRVFRTELSAESDQDPIGFCEIGKIANGICVISAAEVIRSQQRKGIASAVYDLITADMSKVGCLLWPVSPRKMTDAEFKVWWRRSPALVFYYPHRYRLGLTPRPEFEELYDDAVNQRLWDRAVIGCSTLLSRFRRSACLRR